MESDVLVVLGWTFLFLVFVVGGYVFMFLSVMRVDPREKEFRNKHGHPDTLVPHKYKSELEELEKKNSAKKTVK